MTLAQALLEVLYPSACAACSELIEPQGALCAACLPRVERVNLPFCERCGEPFPRSRSCGRCSNRSPPMVRAFAPFVHSGPLAKAIHRWKYEDHPELSRPLAGLLASHAAPFIDEAPMEWVAVPLHANRFHERRYDQTQLLASQLAKLTGRRILHGALTRARETERQVGLAEQEREENMRDAFKGGQACRGKEILLLDDVLTTGATVRSATEALLEAGARKVWVLTLARAHTTG